MKTKICSNCGRELPATTEYFHKKKDGKYGIRAECKFCVKKYSNQRYEENKEQIIEHTKQYYKENKQQIKKYRKQYYENNKEHFLYKQKQYYEENKEQQQEKMKQWYKENKERISNVSKQYDEENKERIRKYAKRYREENREKGREKSREYYYENKERVNKQRVQNEKKQLKTDIGYRLLVNCRQRLRQAIKGNTKSVSTKELIGCSIEHLLQHLESQFQEGMTWDNYGEWHIDHIKPCALFDFTKEEAQRECFNYKNLQPLWAADNIRKSCNY